MRTAMIILTGEPQEGKSSLLARCLDRVSLRARGFLARGLWNNNQREGFDLIDLASGEITPLARRNHDAEPGTIPFTFFNQGMAAGIRALEPERCRDADLVCVDEVGRLELRNQGWAPCLAPLLHLHGPVHLWVVRRKLVSQVIRTWELPEPALVSASDPSALPTLTRLLTNAHHQSVCT